MRRERTTSLTKMFGGIITSPRGSLSPQQALDLARVYLEYACKATDAKIALVLCHDTEVSLSQAKRTAKHAKDNTVNDGVATAYIDLGKLLHSRSYHNEAQASFKKAQKLGRMRDNPPLPLRTTTVYEQHTNRVLAHDLDRPTQPPRPSSVVASIKSVTLPMTDAPVVDPSPPPLTLPPGQHKQVSEIAAVPLSDVTTVLPSDITTGPLSDITPVPLGDIITVPPSDISTVTLSTVPLNIFIGNVRPPVIVFKPPEADERLSDTLQLACCLDLLQASTSPDDILDPAVCTWLQATKSDADEQERLKVLATDVIRAFKRDELKDAKAVAEVVFLAPVLEKDDFQYLMREFYSGIDQSGLLDVHQLQGIAQLIQGADSGYLEADDLVKVLQLLNTRLTDTHHQSPHLVYKLALTVSHVLDAMADADVKDLDREKLHEPLSSYLEGLKKSRDPYLVYQAAYAYQALLCVPDNEKLWQAAMRRTGKVIKGVSGLVSATKGLDLNGFIDGLKDIQKGLAGAYETVRLVKTTYDGVTSLAGSGQRFMDCLKEGLSFNRKCAWYPALRGADALLQGGHLATFRKLICEVPCRHDPAFQWGVCHRLGNLAANPKWDPQIRQGAIAFLGEIYQNDAEWGRQATVKQWILSILMQLSSTSMDDMQFVDTLLEELGKSGDNQKQALCRASREDGPGTHPLKVVLPVLGSPSLLDRVQERLDVEGNLRQQKKQRLKTRGNAVYIPPQAKATLEDPDAARFPLMETVKEFLANDQMVFLLLGDSGSGKSTFNRELEYQLWQTYKKNGPIPLHINLPAIDKPEHNMIAKQLRKAEFTEPQIRELKLYRKFILICDGYDESQQTHNLYRSNRLNEPGEWNAKMVISCRSEYIGVDFQDRFQPGDRNHRSEEALFQEAVITPFSLVQVQDYIDQYVSVHRPLWEAEQYKRALDGIPSLRELVKNPFLMSLSLEVLPRMVDPGHNNSATRITRLALYDQFVEHWLERGMKRLGEKNMSPQARAAFESLIDEGFIQNGIDFLKRLSVAIYKEQDGQPIVRYSRYKDERSWKADFFSREDEKQLLREACPLARNGNQHRFIHRSLLEYGLALAVFDPQDQKETSMPSSAYTRRESTGSDMSFVLRDTVESVAVVGGLEPDHTSPLAWRSFVDEPSVLQFLEERVQQEPVFKQLLLDYIEYSKTDKKWRIAAANAITILVRIGTQFNHADLQGIQIPGADLSYGVFESAQLEGADLRHVNLRGAWLEQANLNRAQMTGIRFGEQPHLTQDSELLSIAYSPSGKTFAVALSSGIINMYSTSNWERLWTASDNMGKVMSLAYSPKGDQIASGGLDRTVRLWDVETGACRHVLTDHSSSVNCVVYSPKGNQLASASNDRTVRLWNANTWSCSNTLIGHAFIVTSVVYSPKACQIASSSYDKTVRLWDVSTGVCCNVLVGHRDSVVSVVYSPRGDQIASVSKEKTVRLWDVETGECLHILTGHCDAVYFATYSPKGDQLASASNDMTVRLWDVKTGKIRHVLIGHTMSVNSVAYSSRGDQIASASNDQTVRLWDPETGECRQTLFGHTDKVNDVVYSPKGDQLASISVDRTVRRWDVKAGTSLHLSGGHNAKVWSVKYSPRGDQVASCSKDGTIRLRDAQTGTCRHTLAGHRDAVYYVAYSPKGDQLASASHDCTIRLWDVETGECCKILSGHARSVLCLVYSPRGNQLASWSGDSTVRLWDVETGVCSHILSGHSHWIESVVYSPQGNQIASASDDSTVRLWDVETGECVHILTGHSHYVWFATYSPNGDVVVSASMDKTVRLWDVASGECRHTLSNHSGGVTSVAYSPHGGLVASGSLDRTVRLWDVETGACLHSLTGHSNIVSFVTFSPQGDRVGSVSNDQTVRLWDVALGQCRAVIQCFSDMNEIAWSTTLGVNHLAAGSHDGSVRTWDVIDDGDDCHVRWGWRTTNGELNMKDATIQDARGLSQLNRQLLEQRGAVGKPVNRLREVKQKVTSVASVVSKLKASSNRKVMDSLTAANTFMEQSEP